MKIKERAYTLLLLLLLLVGGGGVLSPYMLSCHDDIAHKQQHSCCSCKQHIEECNNHSVEFKHDCRSTHAISLQYVNSTSTNSSSNSAGYIYIIKCNDIDDISLSGNICTTSYYVDDDDILRSYNPTTGALRAPPAFV